MDWGGGREATITQLQRQVRETGSFVDRAIVREMKIASELFAERHAAWAEVRELADHWEKGVSDVKILEAIRWINRSASCWKTLPRANSIGAQPPDLLPEPG
jgi:Mn-dependent DtxR family transcriptional regulator